MKKFFKLGKRMLALFIVVLLNINSYAAVGANDGSAFVTKAEFDALVNTFNDQMDTYQSGLNTKIDGAIANYLAGLSSTQTETRSPLVTTKTGVWSVSTTSDKHEWTEGSMALKFRAALARYKTVLNQNGGHEARFGDVGAGYFREHIIDNVYNDAAEYTGYHKTTQKGLAIGISVDETSGSYTMSNYNYSNIGIREFWWDTGGDVAGVMVSSAGNNHTINTGSIIRKKEETLIDTIICTPTALTFDYFNLDDTAGTSAKWCYDKNILINNLHTMNPKYNVVFAGSSISGSSVVVSGSSSYVSSHSGTFNLSTANSSGGTNVNRVWTKPFLGFSTDINDFKKLYLTQYDDIISDLINVAKCHTAKDRDGEDHLLTTNGLPLIKVKKDEVVTVPLKFDKIDNEWKNIDIWLKNESFTSSENVKTTTDAAMLTAENVSNMIPSAYSNAITLDCINGNGEGSLKFTSKKDGYVFMKWSVAGNEAAGGGVFHPQSMLVELSD